MMLLIRSHVPPICLIKTRPTHSQALTLTRRHWHKLLESSSMLYQCSARTNTTESLISRVCRRVESSIASHPLWPFVPLISYAHDVPTSFSSRVGRESKAIFVCDFFPLLSGVFFCLFGFESELKSAIEPSSAPPSQLELTRHDKRTYFNYSSSCVKMM